MPEESHDPGRLLEAVHFSAEKHRLQRRKGREASPYINHPIEVAAILARVGGVRHLPTLLAAVLHDTVEDTETTAEEIEDRFGPGVRAIVEEVTDDKKLPKPARKALQVERAPGLSPPAKLIKLADKISNILEIASDAPLHWSGERQLEYLDWAERVIEGVRGTNAPLERFFDETVRRARERLGG